MTVQRGLTTVLLLFVGVSLALVAADLLREVGAVRQREASPASTADKAPKAIVTFFHGATRCAACNAIEAHSRAAIEGQFVDELARGDIAWQAIDYDAPGQDACIWQFGLYGAVVVVADGQSSPPGRWKRLDGVWTHRDPAALRAYVAREVGAFLGEDRP